MFDVVQYSRCPMLGRTFVVINTGLTHITRYQAKHGRCYDVTETMKVSIGSYTLLYARQRTAR